MRSVPGSGTRPITDRAKTALFSILGRDVISSRFLDLFAGTGSVGIEALSRGAEEAIFVERSGRAVGTIYDNLELTGLAPSARVVRDDVFDYLRQEPEPFDYVYIAPPQYREMWEAALFEVDVQPGWLMEDGWVIVQIDPTEFKRLPLQNLLLFDQREYGGVMLCFYALRELVLEVEAEAEMQDADLGG